MVNDEKKASCFEPSRKLSGIRDIVQKYKVVFISLGLALLTFYAFETVSKCGFINLDDLTIVNNAIIQNGLTGSSVLHAFHLVLLGNWIPLTWISHMADITCFGQNLSGHHLHNLVLHILNGLLLFLFLRETTGRVWLSAVAAMLFAIHPLRVESVAWVAERKDVLCGFFGLAALWAYCRYSRNPGVYRYMIVLLLFCLGMMSKPMLMTWPFVMLLLDYWPLGRVRGISPLFPAASGECVITQVGPWQLLFEKIPLFLAAAMGGIAACMAQRGSGSVVTLSFLPLSMRLENAIISYMSYLWKMVYPCRMAIYYPIHVPLSFSVFIVCFVALAVITIWVLYNFRKRPYLFTSWFWYLGTLVPVVGLVQIGEQSMADRYTYLPSIGIAIGLVWLVGNEIQKRPALRIPLGVCAGVTGVIFLIGTWIQVNYWKDGLTLFKRTLEITENNWMIEQSYAMALEEVGDLDLAEKHALRVLEISPNRSDTCVLLGAVYLKKNQLDNAEMYLQKALQFNYNRPEDAYFYLGLVFTRQKKYDMAQEYLKRAMDRHFSPIMVLYALGEVYRDKGDFKQAFEMWQKVLTLDSTQTEAMTYLAWNMATCADPNQSNPSAAVEYAVQAAERTGYESASVLDVLAAAYARAGDFGRAVNTADRAIQIAEKKSLHDLIADIKKRKQCYEDKKAWVQEPR